MTAIEVIAAVFGIACVWLSIRRSIWCWPTGLVQVILYVWVFYRARLYSDVGLHVFYIGLQLYGWHHWLRGGDERGGERRDLPISRLTPTGWAIALAAGAAGALVLGNVTGRLTGAALPYWDGTIVAFSLVGQVLLARKVLENWLFWIIVDVLGVGVYAAKHLYPTTVLYAVFGVMAVSGWFTWRKVFRRMQASAATGASSDRAPLP